MQLHHATLEFLKAINEHNSRKYFATIRPLYDEIWENIQQITAALLDEMKKIDSEYADVLPKECLFRIYRDARRIKEWDPIYKDNFGIVISPGGKKSDLPGFYLHIQWGNKSFFGGGLYWANKEQLYNLRCYIKKHGEEYKKLVSNKSFKKYFGTVEWKKSIRLPDWFNPYDPFLDIIMLKQHLIYSPISDKELLSVDIVKLCMERAKAAKEWMDFLIRGCITKAK